MRTGKKILLSAAHATQWFVHALMPYFSVYSAQTAMRGKEMILCTASPAQCYVRAFF